MRPSDLTPVDLLAFGPHPTISRSVLAGPSRVHAALGFRVGLCDLTRGELGSNGTPDEREGGGRSGARRAGRRVAGEPALARRRNRRHRRADRSTSSRLIRASRPRTVALPYWYDRHPDHRAASDVLTRAAFKSGLRRSRPERRRVEARLALLLLHQRRRSGVVRDRRVGALRRQARRRWRAIARSSRRPRQGSIATRLTAPQFQQLIESRDAQLGARTGVAFAEGVVVREPIMRPHLFKDWTPLRKSDVREHRHRLLRVGRRQRHRRHRARASRWRRAGTRSTCSAPTRRSGSAAISRA